MSTNSKNYNNDYYAEHKQEILARSNARAREKTRLRKIKKWEANHPGEPMPLAVTHVNKYVRKIECESDSPLMEHIEFINLIAIARINNHT